MTAWDAFAVRFILTVILAAGALALLWFIGKWLGNFLDGDLND